MATGRERGEKERQKGIKNRATRRNWTGEQLSKLGRAWNIIELAEHVATTGWKTRSNYEYGQRSRSPVPNSGDRLQQEMEFCPVL